ncbi:MAG: hypothetical protein KA369_06205 [Spirochaetes bacterium]|nr:hypothetical protein [Spirochaetota bacterium]
MKRKIIRSIIMAGILMAAIGLTYAAEPSFTYTMPEGWKVESPKGTVATATSLDNNVHIKIYEFANKDKQNALQLCEKQLARGKHVKVLNPPTDMSKMKDRFGADSVAKMQLVMKRPDGAEVSYRAFVFVKGGTFVVIEAYATKEATKEVFDQANAVIENFKFK